MRNVVVSKAPGEILTSIARRGRILTGEKNTQRESDTRAFVGCVEPEASFNYEGVSEDDAGWRLGSLPLPYIISQILVNSHPSL